MKRLAMILPILVLVGCAKTDPVVEYADTIKGDLDEISEQLNQLPASCGDISLIKKSVANVYERVDILQQTCQIESEKLKTDNKKLSVVISVLAAIIVFLVSKRVL